MLVIAIKSFAPLHANDARLSAEKKMALYQINSAIERLLVWFRCQARYEEVKPRRQDGATLG